jgi:hypothetical protein
MAGCADAVGNTACVVWLSWRVQSPWGVVWQWMVFLFGHVMVPRLPSKWTLQPAWVSGVTPMRFMPMDGKRWTMSAAFGIPGRSSSAVCVDVMTSWLATWTVMGFAWDGYLGEGC